MELLDLPYPALHRVVSNLDWQSFNSLRFSSKRLKKFIETGRNAFPFIHTLLFEFRKTAAYGPKGENKLELKYRTEGKSELQPFDWNILKQRKSLHVFKLGVSLAISKEESAKVVTLARKLNIRAERIHFFASKVSVELIELTDPTHINASGYCVIPRNLLEMDVCSQLKSISLEYEVDVRAGCLSKLKATDFNVKLLPRIPVDFLNGALKEFELGQRDFDYWNLDARAFYVPTPHYDWRDVVAGTNAVVLWSSDGYSGILAGKPREHFRESARAVLYLKRSTDRHRVSVVMYQHYVMINDWPGDQIDVDYVWDLVRDSSSY